VQLVRGTIGMLSSPRPDVRQQAVPHHLGPLVRVVVGYSRYHPTGLVEGIDRAAQDAQPQLAGQRIVTVLAVVEHRQAAGCITEVHPGLTGLLLAVRRAAHPTVWGGCRHLGAFKSQWEGHLQHAAALVPVYGHGDVDGGRSGDQSELLGDGRRPPGTPDANGALHRAVLHERGRLDGAEASDLVPERRHSVAPRIRGVIDHYGDGSRSGEELDTGRHILQAGQPASGGVEAQAQDSIIDRLH